MRNSTKLCGFWMVIIMAGSTYGQKVLWADEVVGFSSEFVDKSKSPRYRATQILGKPNVMPQGGESPCAWSPKKKNKGKEWIHVRFEESMQIKQVAIAENFRCGTVMSLKLIDDQGKGHKIKCYEACPEGTTTRMYRINMPLTPYKVKEVVLYLRPVLVKGWNHIDAIGISDSDTPIEAKINVAETDEEMRLEKLNSNVNSNWDDLKPMISPDGKSLFIVRKNHPQNFGTEGKDDIWVSGLLESGWGPAIQLKSPLNNKDHNYVNGVSPDGNVVLLGNVYGSGGNIGKGMSMSHKHHGKWSTPTPLNIHNYYNHSKYMESHITSNFKAIVMAIWRNDTYGNKDLYVSFNQGGDNWSQPKNLGPTINTASAEMGPFLAADGRTLYYSSAGFSGYGDYDIYMSQRLDETWQNWSEPINMGPIINSDTWDAYLSLDAEGEYAFLSRGEKEVSTMTDIYKIHLAEKTRPAKMQVVEILLEGYDGEEAMLSYAGIDDPTCSGIAYSKEADNGHVVHFTTNPTGKFVLMITAPGYKPVEYELDVGKYPLFEFKMEKEGD